MLVLMRDCHVKGSECSTYLEIVDRFIHRNPIVVTTGDSVNEIIKGMHALRQAYIELFEQNSINYKDLSLYCVAYKVPEGKPVNVREDDPFYKSYYVDLADLAEPVECGGVQEWRLAFKPTNKESV